MDSISCCEDREGKCSGKAHPQCAFVALSVIYVKASIVGPEKNQVHFEFHNLTTFHDEGGSGRVSEKVSEGVSE